MVKEFILEWRYAIILLAGCGIYSFFEWNNVKNIIYKAMLAAKQLAKDKIISGGEAQENWVLNRAYSILPSRVKMFISEESLRKIIKYLYIKSMDYLDDGKINNSYSNNNKDENSEEEITE